jgi:hypothetical protein
VNYRRAYKTSRCDIHFVVAISDIMKLLGGSLLAVFSQRRNKIMSKRNPRFLMPICYIAVVIIRLGSWKVHTVAACLRRRRMCVVVCMIMCFVHITS